MLGHIKHKLFFTKKRIQVGEVFLPGMYCDKMLILELIYGVVHKQKLLGLFDREDFTMLNAIKTEKQISDVKFSEKSCIPFSINVLPLTVKHLLCTASFIK